MIRKQFFIVLTAFLFFHLTFAADFIGISDKMPENALQIHQIDSGSTVADIYVIRLPDQKVIVVDTGEAKTAEAVLIPALNRLGIKKIEE